MFVKIEEIEGRGGEGRGWEEEKEQRAQQL